MWRLAPLLAGALGLAACGPAPEAATPPPPERGKIRGVSWVAGPEPVTSGDLAPLRSHHVEWIAQTPFGWQTSPDSPEIRLITDGPVYWGERDVGLEVTTRLAREQGLRTLVKPHIWLTEAGGGWRGDIAMGSEEDWRRWFADYRRFLLHYARLAERLGAEALCVGTELHGTVVAREVEWRQLIAEVRGAFSGELTYAANWYREAEEVPFWDALDWIGLQAYYPLGEATSREQLRAAWRPHAAAIAALSARHGKPVVFTEIGYRSAPDATVEPWAWPQRRAAGSPAAGGAVQALAYEAFFATFWERDWFAGAFVWKWYPDPGRARHPHDFTPQGKPAADVLRAWYGRRGAGIR